MTRTNRISDMTAHDVRDIVSVGYTGPTGILVVSYLT